MGAQASHSVSKAAAPPVMAMQAKQAEPTIQREQGKQGFAPVPLRSLAAIPARPSVQRKCAACSAEEEAKPRLRRRMEVSAAVPSAQRKCASCQDEDRREGLAVQSRLEVGPAGDRYEREADQIAGRVMAMRADEAGSAGATEAGATVQRACSACSRDKDTKPRLLRSSAAGLSEVARVRAHEGAGETIAASDSQLTSGGSPLPAGTRSFFEERMGRDLSDVRVHAGDQAQSLNSSIAARAFTYQNHIWLGAGETASPSFTMAHELAHVMQQTAPGPVGPAPRRVMRIECKPSDESLFFVSTTAKQKVVEQNFIKKLTTGANMIGEAPVPNATRSSSGCGAIGVNGFSDIVWSSNGKIPGFRLVEKTGAEIPRPWYSPSRSALGCQADEKKRLVPSSSWWYPAEDLVAGGRKAYIGGKELTEVPDANQAPRFDSLTKKFTVDAADAPTSIKFGEAKFGGTRSARKGAAGQIDNYAKGAQFVRSAYENIRQNIDRGSNELEGGAKPSLTTWSKLDAGPLTSISGVSDDWEPQGSSEDLAIAKFIEVGKLLVPKRCTNIPATQGKLYHGHDTTYNSVWLYAYYPDTAPPQNLPGKGSKFTSYQETAEKLLSQATAAPGADAKKVKPLRISATLMPAQVMRKAKPAKAIPETDPFKEAYPQWKEDRKKLSKEFGSFEGTEEFSKSTLSLLFNQALKNTKEIKGKSPNSVEPDTSDKIKKAEKSFFHLELLSGPAGAVVGELRYRLGPVFLKILAAYQKIRDKIDGFFKRKDPGSGGSGLGARALKVFLKIIGAVASYMLPRVTDALIACVEDGFRNTLETWFSESPLASIKDTIDGYIAKADALKEEIFGEVGAFVERMFGPLKDKYEAVIEVVKDVADIVGIAKKAFDVARALACLAGGLETAGISCIVSAVDKLLGLVGLSPSEHLMAWLLETCPAKEYFAKAILAYQQIKKIPQEIAKRIVELVRPALPPWLQTFLCDPATMDGINAELPTFDEVACDGSEHGVDRGGRPGEVGAEVDQKPDDRVKPEDRGFDKDKWANERPKVPQQPKPQQPAPENKPGQADAPPKPTGDAASGNDQTSGATDTATHAKEITDFDPAGKKTGVLVIVHPTSAQGGLAVKDYGNLASKNRISIIDSDNNKFGPSDKFIEIVIHRVYPNPDQAGAYKIDFALKTSVRLTLGDNGRWIEILAGEYNKYTQVGAVQ